MIKNGELFVDLEENDTLTQLHIKALEESLVNGLSYGDSLRHAEGKIIEAVETAHNAPRNLDFLIGCDSLKSQKPEHITGEYKYYTGHPKTSKLTLFLSSLTTTLKQSKSFTETHINLLRYWSYENMTYDRRVLTAARDMVSYIKNSYGIALDENYSYFTCPHNLIPTQFGTK